MNEIMNMDEEIRCGYKVSAVRKRLWMCELRLYARFNEVCRKYGLKHFLIYGSALGAVRHKGFIPWDDDMDIGMVRKDFDIFVNTAKNELEQDGTISITFGIVGNKVSPLLRIRDNSSTGIIRGEQGINQSKGAFIEIYVFDEISDDEVLRKQQISHVEQLQYETNFKLQKPIINSKDKLVTYIRLFFKSPCSLWEETVVECKRFKGEYINVVMLPVFARTGEVCIPACWTEEIVEVPYENIHVCVLKKVHEQLKICYGDYMILPPKEKRGKHHQTTVFYDPDHPYTFYEESDIPDRFFEGKIGELI